ncbi:MAG: hypothetical protein J6W75_01420 [Bacteroidaceae bacterium]|nr:hypothetical protein [Bacteroidaceae bacterium]
MKTSKSISIPIWNKVIRLLCILTLLELPIQTTWGQTDDTPPADEQAVLEIIEQKTSRKPKFLDGAAVGVDLVGIGMKVAGTDWSQMEVFARLNFFDKYFPIFELGLGEADHEGPELENHFKIRAPYFRLGADYNFAKKHNGNRIFGGLRYGFSAYTYDLDSSIPLTDPVWGTSQPFHQHNLSGNLHWLEAVFGIETKLWSIVRLGWDVRFKFRLAQKASDIGQPWYFPGYGKNGDGVGWGGTFKLVFDI